MAKAKPPVVSTHPGFDKMVHKGGPHPGHKAATKKAMQSPMPQAQPGTMPMQGSMVGPSGNDGEGC